MSEIIVLTFSIALFTPIPLKDGSLSLSSWASRAPVEAPDGTAARPLILSLVVTSTSIVGFALESNI